MVKAAKAKNFGRKLCPSLENFLVTPMRKTTSHFLKFAAMNLKFNDLKSLTVSRDFCTVAFKNAWHCFVVFHMLKGVIIGWSNHAISCNRAVGEAAVQG